MVKHSLNYLCPVPILLNLPGWEDEVDGYLHILVKAGPNLSSQTRTATFPFYDNNRLHITLSQAGGGHIVDKALSFTETNNGVRVIIPETQMYVGYYLSYGGEWCFILLRKWTE